MIQTMPTLFPSLAKKIGGIIGTSKTSSNRRGKESKCSSSWEIPAEIRREKRKNWRKIPIQ